MLPHSILFALLQCLLVRGGYDDVNDPLPRFPPAMAPTEKDYNEVRTTNSPQIGDSYLVRPPVQDSEQTLIESSGKTVEESSGKTLEENSGNGFGNQVGGESEGSAEGESSGMQDEEMHKIMADMSRVAQKAGVTCPADILFVIDSTSSVKGIFDQYKQYVAKVIEGLSISNEMDRVGVVLFAGLKIQREKIRLGAINETGRLISAIKGLPFLSGITATGAALNFAKSALAKQRKHVPTVVVVITDGFSYDLTAHAAKQLRTMDSVQIYTVSFGSAFVEKELIDIAGDKQRFLKGENSYAKLVNVIKNCPLKNKEKKLKVETATVRHIETATDSQGRHLIPNPVLTNKGYKHFDDRKDAGVIGSPSRTQNGPPLRTQIASTSAVKNTTFGEDPRDDIPAPSCQNDIVIVFDASGSTKRNFDVQLELANEIVDKFVVGPKDTQFAAIKFAGKTHCKVLFNFTQYSDRDRLQQKINQTSFISGITATNEALMKAKDLFSGPGARRDVAKPVLIIFTDGFSSESPIQGATYLHKQGVTVFVVGIGQKPEQVYMEELKMIASDSAHVYLLSNFEKFLVDLEILGKNCIHH